MDAFVRAKLWIGNICLSTIPFCNGGTSAVALRLKASAGYFDNYLLRVTWQVKLFVI
jgi:hypothetical protein